MIYKMLPLLAIPIVILMYLLYQRSCPMITGGGNQLYHGSPYKVSVLKPNKPRSHDEDSFTHTKGVFFTTSKKDAMIYAVARDKDRNNRGWAVFNGKLYIKDKLKGNFNFNKEGYLYVINKKDHKCLKGSTNEYVITCSVKPDKIITVTYDDIKNDIIYIDEDGKRELEMRMNIRKIQKSDIEKAKKLVDLYQIEQGKTPRKISDKDFWNIAKNSYVDNKVKSMATLEGDLLRLIVVDKDHRGKGLGKALMTYIKDDVNRLIIDKPTRTDLVSYYKKFGFNKTKETDDYIEMCINC